MAINKRVGYRSPKNGHLGVYTICSGPDPKGPVPGERLIIVIYDNLDTIVRKLEQIQGRCLDEGYVDYFNSINYRPSVHEYYMIDSDKDDKKEILATHTTAEAALLWLKVNVPKWIEKNGVPQL
jgi:hypothetical protein